jgi:hypothetical protein
MKQTQISLGFTDKDVDGIRGIKTTAAINARDEVSAQIMALKKIDLWTLELLVQSNLGKKMRQEKRAYRKAQREIQSPS